MCKQDEPLFQAVLRKLNIPLDEFTQEGDELHGKCPFHDSKGEVCFHVNLMESTFRCTRCDLSGNVVRFVMRVYRVRPEQAINWLTQFEQFQKR